MLIALDRLLVRVRQVPSRATELNAVRDRLRRELRATPGPEERAAATEVRRLKRALSEATGAVSACSSCGKGLPLPGGAFVGGYCCQVATATVFSDDEVAMLAQGGTHLPDLEAPRSLHAGCAFRGETACTLEVEDRPAVCVRFACIDLRRELHKRGRLDAIEELEATLDEAYRRFSRLRAARLDAEWATELMDAVSAARDQRRG